MNSTITDGGSAFPTGQTPGHYSQEGMSLRDWFAGQVLSSWCGKSLNGRQEELVQDVARYAYYIADAMLAARDAK